MSHHQSRQFGMAGGGNNAGGQFGDTTYTKIFVGGLAWETQRETMRRYFEQFGDIQEAVVITDKNTGRSKGYGFVTFKDPDAATRACYDPSPVIDGRRANCNLASFGAQRTRPSTPQQHGMGRHRAAASGFVTPPSYQGSTSSAYFHQPAQYAYPYSAYGYSGYSQDNMYPMNYYNVYGGQQFSPYFAAASASAPHGVYPSAYPFYAQYGQSSQTQGYGIQYPQMVQYPYLPPHYSTTGILSLPNSGAPASSNTGVTASAGVTAGTGSRSNSQTAAGTTTEHSPSPA
ncbi:hypothetical protein IFM89_039695 [Coptis chinensis]|uniref:RRM domain-containing protein n=1 Tax=Coptis chinensis TaxID=261450 RepID=A0A835GVU7_9MAGN|nr:hypothetical protein IFM89_039695 [Coptis chinensis]